MIKQQGRTLSVEEKQIFKPYFVTEVIKQARIVDGYVPFWLRSDMRADVINTQICLRADIYKPNTKRGVELLGHELMHVFQFLQGMNRLTYCWSCRKGYKKSRYEIEAYAKG